VSFRQACVRFFGGRVSLAVVAVICGGQPMNARKTGDLPADLENTRRRLERWRQRHQAPTPLPESLWAEAVKLAGRYGVSGRHGRWGLGTTRSRTAWRGRRSPRPLAARREARPRFWNWRFLRGAARGNASWNGRTLAGEDAGASEGRGSSRSGGPEPQFLEGRR